MPQKESTLLPKKSIGSQARILPLLLTIESFGMYACNGILFNHESKRRGETLLPENNKRSCHINCGLEKCIYLGNLDAKEIGIRKRLC